MTDGERSRRRWDDEPITVGELARRFDTHERATERTHRELARMIEKLDARTDVIATRVTVVFSVVAVLWALFLVIAPYLRAVLGVPTGG